MDTRKIDSEIKMNKWIEIIRESRISGQSVRSWCIEHDVNEKRYYYWLEKLERLPAIPYQLTRKYLIKW